MSNKGPPFCGQHGGGETRAWACGGAGWVGDPLWWERAGWWPHACLLILPTAGGHLACSAVLVNFQPAWAGACSWEGLCGLPVFPHPVEGPAAPGFLFPAPLPLPVPLEPAEFGTGGLWEGGAVSAPEPAGGG